jgi:putative (di)nucleoside polyphosphate hydrolase
MEKMNSDYRKCVAIFLRKYGEPSEIVFSAERIDIPGAWQIPQGGVEDGESYQETAQRELYEETGITSIKIIKSTETLWKYDFPTKVRTNLQKKHNTPFKGQEIKFFLFDFIGKESEINLSCTKPREFSHWKWTPVQELLNSLIEFKQQAFHSAAVELGLCNGLYGKSIPLPPNGLHRKIL